MKQLFADHQASTRGQALAVLALLLFSTPLIVTGLRQARFDGRPVAMQDGVASVKAGADETVIVTWPDSRVDDPRIAALRQNLLGTVAADGLVRGGSPLVSDVIAPGPLLAAMTTDDFEASEAAKSLSGLWLGHGGLKIRATSVGRRDLDWTASRIEAELRQEGRQVAVVVKKPGAFASSSPSPIAIPDYDIEVFCSQASDPAAVPADLRDLVFHVRGYPTADEPNGQRLIDEAFEAIGTPVAVRVQLSDSGRAEPKAAAAAIRRAAVAAGVPEGDLLIAGSLLTIADRAVALRAAAVSFGKHKSIAGPISPITLTILAAALIAVAAGGWNTQTVAGLLMGGVGALAFVAGVNALGIAWTDSLLVLPAILFALTVAMAVLSRATNGRIEMSMRQPLSAATLLCALCVVTLLTAADMHRPSERILAIGGAVACVTAWILATIATPAISGMFAEPKLRREAHGVDFAEWIVTHRRMTASVACALGVATAALLLQPGMQHWVAAPNPAAPHSPMYQIERSLVGGSDVSATIRFDSETTQRLRFLERADIVRAATQRLRDCKSVTGAMSLAELAPVIAAPAENAKTRERNAYVVKSNKAEEQLRAQNGSMGGKWFTSQTNGDDTVVEERWTIQAAVGTLSPMMPADIVAEMHAALQDVLRFQAGATHQLSGDIVAAAEHSATPSRRPLMIGGLISLLFLLAAVGTRSLTSATIIATVASTPASIILILPGFRPEQFGVVGFLAISMSLACGILSCVRLANDFRDWSAATATRAEALALAFAGSTSRGRQVLCVLLTMFTGMAFLAPTVAPAAMRAGVWAGCWAMAASQGLFPLLVAGRLGKWLAHEGRSGLEHSNTITVSTSIRSDSTETAIYKSRPAA